MWKISVYKNIAIYIKMRCLFMNMISIVKYILAEIRYFYYLYTSHSMAYSMPCDDYYNCATAIYIEMVM